MTVASSTAIFLISLLAIPTTFTVNTAQNLHGEIGLFVSGVGALTLICFLTYFFVGKHATDPLYYVLTLGTFAAAVDLIIALETDGYVKGLMTNYLKDGEPYLQTPYGTWICYVDGILHYLLYLLILWALAYNQSYREVGLFWAGSIGHSMVVFIPGNVIGKYGIRPSFLLNVPYIFMPFMSAARFLSERPRQIQTPYEAQKSYTSILKRPLDIFLVTGLVCSMCVAFYRGFAAMGCNNEYFKYYIEKVEPYLEDTVAYPKMQMLVYMFYFVLYYIMAIYGLLYPGCSWMPDWALLHAGAAINAQVSHIGGSFHSRTAYSLRPPNASLPYFWIINATLLILPQILAWRCNQDTSYFLPKGGQREQKKSN